MKASLIFIALFFFIKIDTFSQSWSFIGRNTKNEVYYIRKYSTVSSSTKIWIKFVSKSVSYTKRGKTLYINGYSISLYDTDCLGRRLNIRGITTYSASGNLVNSWSKEEYEDDWNEVIPDSVGEMFLEKACEIL